MPEEQQELRLDWSSTTEEPSSAAVARFYRELGEDFEKLRLFLSNQENSGIFPYQLVIRWPSEKKFEFLVILKALSEDGPLLAFHSDAGLLTALRGITSRARSGKLKLRQDDYPPDDWERLLEFRAKRLR